MKVLVTGGGGFLGKHVLRELKEAGHEAESFDLPQDVRSLGALLNASKGKDHIIHMAGVLGTAELFDKAHVAIDTNIGGTLNVLQACDFHGLGFTGITMPSVWKNVYQATKTCSRDLASAWNQYKNVPVSHVKAFNAYGEGQKVHGVQKIIPTFAHYAWRDKPIPIWGTGQQMVDLIWAGDIAKMMVEAVRFGNDDVFDAGTGIPMTVNAVAEFVLDVTGSQAGIEYHDMRDGETPVVLAADVTTWAGLENHPRFRYNELVKTINWYKQDRP